MHTRSDCRSGGRWAQYERGVGEPTPPPPPRQARLEWVISKCVHCLQAVHDTAETVASIPEAATAAGGSALHSLKAHAEGISLVAKHYALQSFKVLYEACAASLASAKRFSSQGLSALVRFRGGRRSPMERLFVEGWPKLRSLSGRSYQVVRRTAEGGWEVVKHGPVEGLRATLQVKRILPFECPIRKPIN